METIVHKCCAPGCPWQLVAAATSAAATAAFNKHWYLEHRDLMPKSQWRQDERTR